MPKDLRPNFSHITVLDDRNNTNGFDVDELIKEVALGVVEYLNTAEGYLELLQKFKTSPDFRAAIFKIRCLPVLLKHDFTKSLESSEAKIDILLSWLNNYPEAVAEIVKLLNTDNDFLTQIYSLSCFVPEELKPTTTVTVPYFLTLKARSNSGSLSGSDLEELRVCNNISPTLSV